MKKNILIDSTNYIVSTLNELSNSETPEAIYTGTSSTKYGQGILYKGSFYSLYGNNTNNIAVTKDFLTNDSIITYTNASRSNFFNLNGKLFVISCSSNVFYLGENNEIINMPNLETGTYIDCCYGNGKYFFMTNQKLISTSDLVNFETIETNLADFTSGSSYCISYANHFKNHNNVLLIHGNSRVLTVLDTNGDFLENVSLPFYLEGSNGNQTVYPSAVVRSEVYKNKLYLYYTHLASAEQQNFTQIAVVDLDTGDYTKSITYYKINSNYGSFNLNLSYSDNINIVIDKANDVLYFNGRYGSIRYYATSGEYNAFIFSDVDYYAGHSVFILNAYKTLKANINGSNFTYTINGNNDGDEHYINLANNFVINITPDSNYNITGITSEKGVVDMEESTITYEDASLYIEDNINVETEFAIFVNPGWYDGNKIDLQNISITLNAQAYKTDGTVLDITKINFNQYGEMSYNDYISVGYLKYFQVLETFAVEDSNIQREFNGAITTEVFKSNLSLSLDRGVKNYEYENNFVQINDDLIFYQIDGSLIINYTAPYYIYNTCTCNNGTVVFDSRIKATITFNEYAENVVITATSLNDAFDINLYNNKSEKDSINKDLELITFVKGRLKNKTSKFNPVIVIEYNDILKANYCYINIFGRYYFINDIISVSYNLWEVHMTTDALESFKYSITNTNAYISRSSVGYDNTITDNLEPLKSNLIINESEIPDNENKGFKTDLNNEWNVCITLANSEIVNNASIDPGVFNDAVGDGVLPNIHNWDFNTGGVKTYILHDKTSAQIFLKALNANAGASSQYINGFVFPFNLLDLPNFKNNGIVVGGKMGANIKVNNDNIYPNDIDNIVCEVYNINYYYLNQFSIQSENKYLDINGKYELYLPYYGWISLNYQDIYNKNVNTVYSIDLANGNCQVSLTIPEDNKYLFNAQCQLGISIATNFDNSAQIENSRNALNSNTAISAISGVLTTGVGIASGNPVAIAGGALSLAKTFNNYNNTMNTLYTQARGTVSSGLLGLYAPNKARLKITKQESLLDAEDLNDFINDYGKPVNKVGHITESGFYQFGQFHFKPISNDVDKGITNDEINEIESKLQIGIKVL